MVINNVLNSWNIYEDTLCKTLAGWVFTSLLFHELHLQVITGLCFWYCHYGLHYCHYSCISQDYVALQWVSSKEPGFIKVSPFKAEVVSLKLLTSHYREGLLRIISMLFALHSPRGGKIPLWNREGLLGFCRWSASAFLCCMKQQLSPILWREWRGHRVK